MTGRRLRPGCAGDSDARLRCCTAAGVRWRPESSSRALGMLSGEPIRGGDRSGDRVANYEVGLGSGRRPSERTRSAHYRRPPAGPDGDHRVDKTRGRRTDRDRPVTAPTASPNAFFSHRRDNGVTGRQAGIVWRSLSADADDGAAQSRRDRARSMADACDRSGRDPGSRDDLCVATKYVDADGMARAARRRRARSPPRTGCRT